MKIGKTIIVTAFFVLMIVFSIWKYPTRSSINMGMYEGDCTAVERNYSNLMIGAPVILHFADGTSMYIERHIFAVMDSFSALQKRVEKNNIHLYLLYDPNPNKGKVGAQPIVDLSDGSHTYLQLEKVNSYNIKLKAIIWTCIGILLAFFILIHSWNKKVHRGKAKKIPAKKGCTESRAAQRRKV